jgi:hypothetical protein
MGSEKFLKVRLGKKQGEEALGLDPAKSRTVVSESGTGVAKLYASL